MIYRDFFAPEIAQQITEAEQQATAGRGQARDAAIMMCDIRGFTTLANAVEPDELIRTLTDYQRQLVPVVQSHGGTIDKFMGDGVMVTFGAAAATDTYAADALRAADAVMAAVDAWNADRSARGAPAIRVGAAVTTGRIIFGAVGDETRLEYTVIGDAVNLAAKLEKHTKVERVRALCHRASFETARAQGYHASTEHEHLAARRVEGVEEPVDLVVLAQ